MLQPGTYLQDRYEILSLIGTGGMSEVYQAKCHTLNRLVAIKVLKEEYSQDANFVSKFKMEAQAAAGLSHPNIVSVYDVVDEGTLHYIVMELIEGITLKSYILKKGRLGVKETIGIAIQVAQGIAAAHDQHIVHRDIKPQNMIISRDGKVKVADFGIARAVSAQTVGVNAVGSVHYISPEQARGGLSDRRSDIYSFGITMFEMVTGHLPFDGENPVSVALAHLEDPLPAPSRLNPEVTPSLDRIILKCTSKRPDRRYQDAYELVADLRRALVDPEDHFLKKEPEYNESSPTVIRGEEEVNQVREAARHSAFAPEMETDNPISFASEMGKGNDDRMPRNYQREINRQSSEQAGTPRTPVRKKAGQDDVNPQMERLLTTIGVVAAILIVVVVVVIFAKLGGIFNLGSGTGESKPTVTVESVVETEESISSTESIVPSLLGRTEAEAEADLREVSLKIRYEYEESEDKKKGLVIRQSVKEGTVVTKQSEITVTIGEGSGQLDLTELHLESMNRMEAEAALVAKQLKVTVQEESSDTIEKDQVIRYEPEKADPGEEVKLFISSGPAVPMVPMPKITGLSEENAKVVLEAVGLQLGERKEQKDPDTKKGTILVQDVPEKTGTPEGTAVGYTVSAGTGTRFVAVVNDDFQLQDYLGPSSGETYVEIAIVMKQVVNGVTVSKTIMEPREMGGNITLPIHYNIEGADGVLNGELQVQDRTHDRVLKTYQLQFVEVDL